VRGYNFPDNSPETLMAKFAIRDESLCEIFGWDYYTLYRQPAKRILLASIVLDERAKIQKEQENDAKKKSGR
jgi:hypothetical protein